MMGGLGVWEGTAKQRSEKAGTRVLLSSKLLRAYFYKFCAGRADGGSIFQQIFGSLFSNMSITSSRSIDKSMMND